MPLLLPKGKKRTELLGKLKEIFRSSRSQPISGVIEKINPILRGWVKYFAIGHSSRCFSFVRYWVEKKIRRHLAKAHVARLAPGVTEQANQYSWRQKCTEGLTGRTAQRDVDRAARQPVDPIATSHE